MKYTYEDFINKALEVKKFSYSPYSKFSVGSVVLMGDRLYSGTNIENASYGATICAERVAIFKGITEGNNIIQLLTVVGDLEELIYPCGICRQVIAEFSNENTKIICSDVNRNYKIYNVDDIIPYRFKL